MSTTAIPDPVREGLEHGWRTLDASTLTRDETIVTDVVIVGSGAGGGVAAELLSTAGMGVVVVEEGPLRSSSDFQMREAKAYPELYQESAARQTADKAITILQGRCVGGGTTVNWTSSFRTPPVTLEHWQRAHGLEGLGVDDLAPWFEKMEARLSVAPWEVPPNENNSVLQRGAARLNIAYAGIRRNVKGCRNLGYCGMGCPVNAKQSMLVTTLPAALSHGARLVTRARAWRLVHAGGRVDSVECRALDAGGLVTSGHTLTVRARHVVLAAGAIGSPAILLRSEVPDPHRLIGSRTFLHPTVISAAQMPQRVAAFSGAPQTIYSDHFLDTLPPSGPMGYKLETPPIHPILAAITLRGFGADHAAWMQQLPHMQVVIALLRDGFHPESTGGSVRLRGDGSPELEYPISPYVWDGARRALLTCAEIQFAAGATRVMPVHEDALQYTSFAQARDAIGSLPMRNLRTRVVSAHVMGGCRLGPDARDSVVDLRGRFHHLENLSVLDGSLFPTSLGANPQLSIYALTAKLATALAEEMKPPPKSV
jgi:choline dehydrogenase-like flavoprotein